MLLDEEAKKQIIQELIFALFNENQIWKYMFYKSLNVI